MSSDKYRNFNDLRQYEREGVAFAIRMEPGVMPAAVIAPHGGKIEPGTSEVVAAIAAHTYNLYCFEGRKRRANRNLHIMSTNFDEPQCLELVTRCDVVVAVHGLKGAREGVDIGGRDHELRDQIRENLRSVGFRARVSTHGSYAAVIRYNICNRGRTGVGAQLEITQGLRDALLADKARLDVFADAVRRAIDLKLSKHDIHVRLRHMLDAAREAVGFCNGRVRADLDKDRMLVLALQWLVERIGEAARHIPPDFRQRKRVVPWDELISARNRLIEDYANVDMDSVWTIVTGCLPQLVANLEKALPSGKR